MTLDGVVQRVGGGMGGGEKEEEGGITIMTADVVDIGIFIVVLQFFAATATVEGGGRVLLQGLFFCFCF